MQKIILFLSAILFAVFSVNAQDCSSYVNDSNFVVNVDKVTFQPVKYQLSDTGKVSIMSIQQVIDYGTQPYADITTQSAAVYFTLSSTSGWYNYSLSLPINNISGTTYDCYRRYGFKYLFWYISEVYGLTIN